MRSARSSSERWSASSPLPTNTVTPLIRCPVAAISSAFLDRSAEPASLLTCSSSPRRSAMRRAPATGSCSEPTILPTSLRLRDRDRNQSIAAGPVSASMRRTFAALDPSEAMAKMPISAVFGTCVPPQSSRDVLDLDHAHPVAVFLAEQGHRPQPLGVHARHLEGSHPVALLDPLV